MKIQIQTIKKKTVPFAKDLINEVIKDDCFNMSAALAYYTTFSLAPMLIILIAIAGFFLEKREIRKHIYNYVAQITTDLRAADLIQNLLDNVSFSSHGLSVTIISAVTVLIGATTVFAALHTSLNKIWNVSMEKRSGFFSLVLQRLVSLLAIFAMGFLLFTALIISAVINIIHQFVQNIIDIPIIVIELFDGLVPIVILYLFFIMVFKLLSDADLRWRHVFIGALVTTLLLLVGRWMISIYLSSTSIGSVYGTAASLATLLIWVYYSSLMVFIGAEFIKVYAWHTGTTLDLNDLKKKEQARTLSDNDARQNFTKVI
jgi:membrane protein